MTAFRLREGGAIDRSRPLHFSFDGRRLSGFHGDTLASALLANDVFLVGRSFKYHRPRGIVAAGVEEPNALVAIGEGGRLDTNTRATTVPLHEGMVARSLNNWPSLGFDLGALNGLFSRMLMAGFYYKTFMWPRRFWHALYEPMIRRMAGIGSAPTQPDPDRYDKVHRHCDVLVVGGGRSGRRAAAEAAQAHERVILCDENAQAPIPGVQVLGRTTVFGYYDDNFVCAVEDHRRLWHFRAREVVLATGAHERPLVFGDNDKPGVMLASAVETYLRRYAVAAGRRVVVFTNNDTGHARAAAFEEFGLEVTLVDARENSFVERALGGRRVTGAVVDGKTIACDLIAMAGGWSPVVHLYSQAQGKLRWDEAKLCFVPASCRQNVRVVGRANGELGERYAIAPLWEVPAEHAFVDFQNDVTSRDVRLAAREGFDSVEHFKRYTTTGMAPDQGKTSNVNAFGLLGRFTGRSVHEVGTTTFRPPYSPVRYGVLAGRDLGELLDPIRVTPIHAWHAAHGAVFENVGQWKRPWYYGASMHEAVQRESRAVRASLGVLDASTLGKIDLQGRDVGTFLDRIYTGRFSTLAAGRARYGLMCREDGMVFDDGVTARLGENHYYMTTTTGGAGRVLDWLEEYLQTEWPELEVYCTSVTEQWATVSVAGPRAADLVKELGLAPDFPFMSFREGKLAGMDARVFRISFTGELSYEINVAGDQGLALWEAVIDAGKKHAIAPYGTETMHLLRAEKGFIIVGQETDGTVTPLDLCLAAMVKKEGDFIGRRSLARADTRRADRKQLVGLLPADPREVLPEGAQITAAELALPRGHGAAPVPMLGHVTSSYFSPNLERSFALALVKGGRSRMGETLFVPLEGRAARVKVVEPVFLRG